LANTKITDLTSRTPASGDEVPINRGGLDGKIDIGAIPLTLLSDTPNAYTGKGLSNVQVNFGETGVEFKYSTAEKIDIRDYSATELTHLSDITTALQATIDARDVDYTCHTILIPRLSGPLNQLVLDPSLIDWGGVDWIVEIACERINLKATWEVKFGMTIRGLSSDTTATYLSNPIPRPVFHPDASSTVDPMFQIGDGVTPAGQCLIENIAVVGDTGSALSAFGTNLFTIRNCSFSTAAAAYPLDINECFWVQLENVHCQPRAAGDYQSIAFRNTSPSGGGTDCGLIRCKELRLERAGILFQADVGPVGTRNIIIEDVLCENTIEDVDLLTFDTSAGNAFVGQIKIIRPEFADSIVAASNYWINVNSRAYGSVYDVYIEGAAHANLIRPTSDPIKNLVINQEIPGAAASSSTPKITHVYAGTEGWSNWKRVTPTAIDTKLLSAPVGLPWVPGTPLATAQDPANWTQRTSGATITTGIRGPDGSTLAGRVSGGGGALCYNATRTLAVGDWIIAGVWMRASTGVALSTRSARIEVSTGFQTNGTSSMLKFNNYGVEDAVAADGWRWFCGVYKVTSLGTNPGTIKFMLSDNSFSCDYFNPCAVVIPTGEIDDAWAVSLGRSLKGGWPSVANVSDVGVLNHQRLRLGGGAAIFSSTASPTTGTGIVGDIAFNKTPSGGQPMGWVCVTAGSPGTWIELATIPSGSIQLGATGTGTAAFVGSSTTGQGALSATGTGAATLFIGVGSTGALALLSGETDGFAIDATSDGGTVAVINTGDPTDNLVNAPLNTSNLVQNGTSAKVVQWDDDTLHTVLAGDVAQEWDGTRWGILCEPAATNLILRSQELDNASWTKVDTTITADDTTAPDSTLTADLFTQGTSGTSYAEQAITIASNTINTYSYYAKRGNTDWLRLAVFNGSTNITGWFNLNTGVVGSTSAAGTGTVSTSSITSIGGDWYRVALTGSLAGGITAATVRTNLVTADAVTTVSSSGTMHAWGFQAELLGLPTSYIATTSATVTRDGDLITCATSTYPHSDSAGTFIVWFRVRGEFRDTQNKRIFTVSNGTTNERHFAFIGTSAGVGDETIRATSQDGGVVQVAFATLGVPSLAPDGNKIGFAYTLNNTGFLLDGGAEDTDSGCTMPTVTTFDLGNGQDTAGVEFNGYIYQVMYLPRRLTEAEMQVKTA
jgi:hypothetical protein